MRGFFFFLTYFFSCNGPCAVKEKWHINEHISIYCYYYSLSRAQATGLQPERCSLHPPASRANVSLL